MQHERRRRPELTAYNLGVRRDRSDQIRARWRGEAEARLPTEHEGRVVFAFGANDAAQAVALDVTVGHGEAMLAEARERWPLLVVGPAPLPGDDARRRLIAIDEALAELCTRLAVPYVTVLGGLIETPLWLDEALAGDGAHPAAAGYRRMADIILASPAWQDWMR
jgi:lysophospholipase L1-like esterase